MAQGSGAREAMALSELKEYVYRACMRLYDLFWCVMAASACFRAFTGGVCFIMLSMLAAGIYVWEYHTSRNHASAVVMAVLTVTWAQMRRTSNSLRPSFTCGPLSAVSTPIFASKYFGAFFEIYKMCILFHRTNLSKCSSKCLMFLAQISKKFDFSSNSPFFEQILLKFYRNSNEISRNVISIC